MRASLAGFSQLRTDSTKGSDSRAKRIRPAQDRYI
jgi:hypothetical protein